MIEQNRVTSLEPTNEETFLDWVLRVNQQVTESGLGVVRFARRENFRPAEVLAVMRLAGLEHEDLEALSRNVPPKTTWLAFASADPQRLTHAVQLLAQGETIQNREVVLRDILTPETEGVTQDALREIAPSTYKHFIQKAKDYRAFTSRQESAFKSLTSRAVQSGEFSEAQMSYLVGLLTHLANHGVITRESRENDQAHCDAVLDALGIQ